MARWVAALVKIGIVALVGTTTFIIQTVVVDIVLWRVMVPGTVLVYYCIVCTSSSVKMKIIIQ